MLDIRSPELIYLVTGRLDPLTNISPFPPPDIAWQPARYFVSMSLA